MTTEPSQPQPDEEEIDYGPYGPRGKDTPPMASMFRGYAIILTGLVILPFLLFMIIRFVIL
ncbi:MAG: hypothetical protein VYC39_00430 [Myxococcota bacterium]|nr:hypothetical protein [Myxococcota bacterium]